MKTVFWIPGKPLEKSISFAFADGLRAHGDECEVRRVREKSEPADCDVVVLFGVKRQALFRKHLQAGTPVLYIDKGFSRQRVNGQYYYRVAVNAHDPLDILTEGTFSPERRRRFDWHFPGWRKSGEHIVIAGSSAKYHAFFKLAEPHAWATRLVGKLKRLTDREIVYRPKPTWHEAKPIGGSTFRHGGSIWRDLRGAHCLITYGSAACLEAVLSGVPSIITGPAIARPISSVTIAGDIEHPKKAEPADVEQWLNNLGHCQWSLPEMKSGEMWEMLRPRFQKTITGR